MKIFIARESQRHRSKENEIIITPDDEKWNDFGNRIRCKMEFYHKGNLFEFRVFFQVMKDGKGYGLSEILDEKIDWDYKSHKAEKFPIEKVETFYTMLPSLSEYKGLIEVVGLEKSTRLLKNINDLVVYQDSAVTWYKDALRTKAFRMAFVRSSESYFAFQNAGSLFSEAKERTDYLEKNFTLDFNLPTFKNSHKISLKYDSESLLPKRINILIGANGLGKSQALNHLTRSVLQHKGYENALLSFSGRERVAINRLIAIGTPGETDNTFPFERPSTQKAFYKRLTLSRTGRKKNNRSMGSELVKLARSKRKIGGRKIWDIFIDALEGVMDTEIIVMPLDNNGKESVRLVDLNSLGGEEKSLEIWGALEEGITPKVRIKNNLLPLSSGQLSYLKFAILSCVYIENGCLVLLDEPETHLHPNYITSFILMLDDILKNTGSYALIATHSPYIARQVPREQVHVFKSMEGDEILITNPRLRTFGADVDSISQFVFEDNFERDLVSKLLTQLKKSHLKKIPNEIEEELSVGASMFLTRKLKEDS